MGLLFLSLLDNSFTMLRKIYNYLLNNLMHVWNCLFFLLEIYIFKRLSTTILKLKFMIKILKTVKYQSIEKDIKSHLSKLEGMLHVSICGKACVT